MVGETFEEPHMEVLPSKWPDDIGDEDRKPGMDQDMLENVNIEEHPPSVDFKRLAELTNYSEKGSSQLTNLVKTWEYKQANVVRLLNEELNILNQQRDEAELRKLEILEEYRFEEEKQVVDKQSISILVEASELWETAPKRKNDVVPSERKLDIDAEYDTIKYWKQRAMLLDKMLEASIQREQALMQKLQKNVQNMETESSPVEELSQILKRGNNFLHFILQNAPVIIGNQDKDLRYQFLYNHFPRLGEEEVIGKTDTEIFSGVGVKEIQEFKKEVMDRGLSAKREITFENPLFGLKTFLIYVEPVFSKAGETLGINYMGMDVTEQVAKREKIAVLREEIAVRKAKETELNKTIHITEETMRAKQMLATMSHEIRSPLTGVVSMAEILAHTKMDKEQRQFLDVMLSSGDLVFQLINDILDLSKAKSGVMKLEAATFRPREVVKHVLQTAAAALLKEVTLEGNVDYNVPIEVIGDVLWIRQVLTNLISNAIKFTHEGKVGIALRVVSECPRHVDKPDQVTGVDTSASPSTGVSEENNGETQSYDDTEQNPSSCEKTVFLCCDVYDTGIGIPENTLPSLFRKYMQVTTDHAEKHDGTGMGLAICKKLVELMGGQLTVISQEKHGSTFTFVLPCKIPLKKEISDARTEEMNVSFIFKPRKLDSNA